MPDPTAPAGSRHARPLTPWTRADYIVLGLLVVLPLVLYGMPALFGHLYVPGDDLNQNLPLRILSGSLISAGRLPAWNPLIWSGTPLLAGWNAGALFPGTMLFAFLPISLAWTINVVTTPILCSLGTYLLLRRFNVSELAAFFGGVIFTYTGFMSGQMVHLGLVEGTSFMPWLILGIDVFLRSDTGDARSISLPRLRSHVELVRSPRTLWWILVLAVALACTVLAGDPRAITSTALVAIIYILFLVIRDPGPLLRTWLPLSIALVLGFLLSAIQSIPGIAFLNASQRGTATLAFFGSGSIPPRELFINALVPFALGNSGNLGQPSYYGNFNLPEVTFGVGLIALVAICAYLPQLLKSLWLTLARRRPPAARDPHRQLGVWLTLFLVGSLLTAGTDTPIGRLFHHLPLYGTERLQNRNAVIFDFALAILAAFFIDDVVYGPTDRQIPAQPTKESFGLGSRTARLLGFLPILATLVMVTIEFISPLTLQRWLQVPFPSPTLASRLAGYLIATLVLAVAIGICWLLAGRCSPTTRRRAMVCLLVLDVGMYIANASYATSPTSTFTGSTVLSAQIKHDLGGQGRFAIFDPLYYLTYSDPTLLSTLGFPDINAIEGNPSVQGYGSIVNGVYQKVTGTHLIDTFNASIIAGESVNTLDLRLLLVPPGYLVRTLSAHQVVPVPTGDALASNGYKTAVSGPWTIMPGATQQWQLPAPTALSRTTILLRSALQGNNPSLKVTLFDVRRNVASKTVNLAGARKIVPLPTTQKATTVALTNPTDSPITINAITVVTNDPHHRLVLNGLLQGELNNGHWVYDGTIATLSAFKNIRIHGFAWLQSPSSHTPNTALAVKGSVQVDRGPVTAATEMTVTTVHKAILVRSEAYSSGWSATLTPVSGGPGVIEKVHRFGLIQQISVPAGSYRITWNYRPSSLTDGLILTIGGAGLTLCLVLALIIGRRRPKRVARDRQ